MAKTKKASTAAKVPSYDHGPAVRWVCRYVTTRDSQLKGKVNLRKLFTKHPKYNFKKSFKVNMLNIFCFTAEQLEAALTISSESKTKFFLSLGAILNLKPNQIKASWK